MDIFTADHRRLLHDPDSEPTELVIAIRTAAAARATAEVPRLLQLWTHPHVRVRAETMIALLARFERRDMLSPALDSVASDKALFNHAADGALLAYALDHPREAPAILRTLARIALSRRGESSAFVERVARDIDGIDKLLTPSDPPMHATKEEIPMSAVWRSLERIAVQK